MKLLNLENLYLNRAKFVMKGLGVWMPPDQESFIHRIYRIIMMTLQYLFLIFQIIYIFQVWGDLEAVSQASYLLFTQACLCFKVTVFQSNMDMLKDLLGRMNGETFRPQSLEHEKVVPLSLCLSAFLFIVSVISEVREWASVVRVLTTMPVKPELSPHYELGYAFQLLTICMSAYMYFGVDSVALSMVIFGCAQLDIIKDKILNIQSFPNKQGTEEDNKKILSENYNKLIECVVHHQAVLSFTKQVENAYHTYLLFQLTGSVGLICMSALRILVVDPQSMQFFSILTYLSVMISQLFVCCWCGHELTATSEDLHTVLYKCMWYKQDLKFKRAFFFIMMRMRHPMVLRAGHYISLSRQTFVAILRMSYSYFAVLNQTK